MMTTEKLHPGNPSKDKTPGINVPSVRAAFDMALPPDLLREGEHRLIQHQLSSELGLVTSIDRVERSIEKGHKQHVWMNCSLFVNNLKTIPVRSKLENWSALAIFMFDDIGTSKGSKATFDDIPETFWPYINAIVPTSKDNYQVHSYFKPLRDREGAEAIIAHRRAFGIGGGAGNIVQWLRGVGGHSLKEKDYDEETGAFKCDLPKILSTKRHDPNDVVVGMWGKTIEEIKAWHKKLLDSVKPFRSKVDGCDKPYYYNRDGALAVLERKCVDVAKAGKGFRDVVLHAAAVRIGSFFHSGLLTPEESSEAFNKVFGGWKCTHKDIQHANGTMRRGFIYGSKHSNIQEAPEGYYDFEAEPGDVNAPQLIKQKGETIHKQSFDWEEPQSLTTALLPVEPFNLDAMLPEPLRTYVKDECDRMDHQPYDYVACALVTSLGAVIGRKVCLQFKHNDTWRTFANIWCYLAGQPSALKTPAISAALKPLYQLIHKATEVFDKEQKKDAIEKRLTELREKEIEEKLKARFKKEGRASARDYLETELHDAEHEEAILKRHMVNDFTTEALGKILSENANGVLIYRDEIDGLFRTLFSGDRENDKAFLLESYNGDATYMIDRIKRNDLIIEHCITSILGGIQPAKLKPRLRDVLEGKGNDGFFQRFQMAVYPNSVIGEWEDRAPDDAARAAVDVLFDKAEAMPLGDDPVVLKWTNEAYSAYKEWHIRERKRWAKEPEHLSAHLAKSPSLLGALALIFHVALHDIKGEVGMDCFGMAIQWMKYLESHARRIYGMALEPYHEAQCLLEKLGKLKNPFQASDFRKQDWTGLKSSAQRQKALTMLCEMGYLRAKKVDRKTLYFKNPLLNKG